MYLDIPRWMKLCSSADAGALSCSEAAPERSRADRPSTERLFMAWACTALDPVLSSTSQATCWLMGLAMEPEACEGEALAETTGLDMLMHFWVREEENAAGARPFGTGASLLCIIIVSRRSSWRSNSFFQYN